MLGRVGKKVCAGPADLKPDPHGHAIDLTKIFKPVVNRPG